MSHDDVTTTHSQVLIFFHLILYFNYISINFKILAVKKIENVAVMPRGYRYQNPTCKVESFFSANVDGLTNYIIRHNFLKRKI
jgi:hypothetical protein